MKNINKPRYEHVDLCAPIDMINQRIKRLESEGYLVVGQSGWDVYETMVFEYAQGDNKDEVLKKNADWIGHCERYKAASAI